MEVIKGFIHFGYTDYLLDDAVLGEVLVMDKDAVNSIVSNGKAEDFGYMEMSDESIVEVFRTDNNKFIGYYDSSTVEDEYNNFMSYLCTHI